MQIRDAQPAPTDLGFTYRTSGRDAVRILRHGREVTVLRGKPAERFLGKAEGASPEAIQQLCARATGNYKRGNEGLAASRRKRPDPE
jgi:hypothetical protein